MPTTFEKFPQFLMDIIIKWILIKKKLIWKDILSNKK